MSASAGLETLKACFEQLYAESAASGRIMNFGMHPHIMGQPHRAGTLREFTDYAKSHDGVWFASREEITAWYLRKHEAHVPAAI
jgi:allantoinase